MAEAIEKFREWKFIVSAENLRSSENVCITGDCDALGNWQLSNVVPLRREADSDTWSKIITVPHDVDIFYRFCICVLDHECHHIVRSWETNIRPRQIAKTDVTWPSDSVKYGDYCGETFIDRGWLTSETMLQLKFFDNPFKLKRKLQNKTLQVKLTPLSLNCDSINSLGVEESLSTDAADTTDFPTDVVTEVAILNANGSRFQEQQQFGIPFQTNDFLIFNVYSKNIEKMVCLIDFYTASNEETPIHVGYTYVLPNSLKSSEGQLELAITCSSKHRPFGSMNLEYLVVKPLENSPCNLRVSYSKHWNDKWTGLDVGHRGLGSSFKTKDATIRENTIASLKTAAASGADMLEFDVQLSKDFIPIIYHDFYACISIKRKRQIEFTDMLELPVKDLTYDQLRKIKVYHRVEGRSNEQRFFDEDLEEHQPFPTLIQAFEEIDKNIGFNVEIKWTMRLHDGTMELNHPFDLNLYIDKILQIILEHGEGRKVVISCFHPDICMMVRKKQNIYPAMFLTQGATERYPSYHDARCNSILAAVQHACSAELLGIVVHTEDLLRDSSQVKLAKDAGLVIFCWGDDNNNKDTIRHLKDLGLHAVIYDKLDVYSDKKAKESVFEITARDSQCVMLEKAAQLQTKEKGDDDVSEAKRSKRGLEEKAFFQLASTQNGDGVATGSSSYGRKRIN